MKDNTMNNINFSFHHGMADGCSISEAAVFLIIICLYHFFVVNLQQN